MHRLMSCIKQCLLLPHKNVVALRGSRHQTHNLIWEETALGHQLCSQRPLPGVLADTRRMALWPSETSAGDACSYNKKRCSEAFRCIGAGGADNYCGLARVVERYTYSGDV